MLAYHQRYSVAFTSERCWIFIYFINEIRLKHKTKQKKKSWFFFSAQEIISKGDTDKDCTMDFEEFVIYMQEHERKLRLAFSTLDRNKDGKLG